MPERNLRFQQKLWQIVNNCKSGAVSWSSSGDSIIFNFSQFQDEYLGKNVNFCKSNKIASFVRQLNLYGFRKLVKKTTASRKRLQDEHEFQNEFFQRGRKDLLQFVVRSPTTPALTKRSKFGHEHRRREKRGRRGRGRGRKIKCEKIETEDADHCYGKVKCNTSPHPKTMKKEPCSSEKYPLNGSWISENKLCEKTKIPDPGQPKPSLPNGPLVHYLPGKHEILNTHENTRDFTFGSIQLPTESNMKIERVPMNNSSLSERKEYIKPRKSVNSQRYAVIKSEKKFANLDDEFKRVSVDEKEDEDEFYKNLMNESSDQSYLVETILFNGNNISSVSLSESIKLCRCYDYSRTEEYLELEATFARMYGFPRSLCFCVCNPNMAPNWMLPPYLR